jgi:hypothetical protein
LSFAFENLNQTLPTAFQYETESGFSVETSNQVLPVFDPDDKSLEWYNFASPHVPATCFASRQTLDFDSDTTALRSENSAGAIYVDSTACSLFDPLAATPFLCVSSVVQEQIQYSCRVLEQQERRIVGQKRRLVLMAGEEYLVARCDREKTEASAEDHITHLEFQTLSRNRSNSNFFSTAVQKLKEFGSRIWFKDLNFSCAGSTFWSRFTRSEQPCPSLVISVGRMN